MGTEAHLAGAEHILETDRGRVTRRCECFPSPNWILKTGSGGEFDGVCATAHTKRNEARTPASMRMNLESVLFL